MTVEIPDELLTGSDVTERDVRVEIACRLYDAEKIGKGAAARMAGLTRMEFEEELIRRDLPLIRYSEEMWKRDLEALEQMREEDRAAGGQ